MNVERDINKVGYGFSLLWSSSSSFVCLPFISLQFLLPCNLFQTSRMKTEKTVLHCLWDPLALLLLLFLAQQFSSVFLYSVFLFAPLWFPLNFLDKWGCTSKSSSAAWLLNLADLTEGQISYQVQQLCITCFFNLQNSRAAAAATVYLVYMLEVLDNLYEQFGVLFMYLVSHSCFVLLLGQATLQKVSPILLRRSIEWKCQEHCSIFNLHLWTADYGLYKPSFSLWFEVWGRKFWNLKRTHHEALQLWMKLLHLQT